LCATPAQVARRAGGRSWGALDRARRPLPEQQLGVPAARPGPASLGPGRCSLADFELGTPEWPHSSSDSYPSPGCSAGPGTRKLTGASPQAGPGPACVRHRWHPSHASDILDSDHPSESSESDIGPGKPECVRRWPGPSFPASVAGPGRILRLSLSRWDHGGHKTHGQFNHGESATRSPASCNRAPGRAGHGKHDNQGTKSAMRLAVGSHYSPEPVRVLRPKRIRGFANITYPYGCPACKMLRCIIA
jgi:hypothetical protein